MFASKAWKKKSIPSFRVLKKNQPPSFNPQNFPDPLPVLNDHSLTYYILSIIPKCEKKATPLLGIDGIL